MKYYALASGSKGNCFIVEADGTRLVIDCGTTKRYLTESFDKVAVSTDAIDAVLITHNHSDHVSQIRMFSHCDIYSPEPLKVNGNIVEPYAPFRIGNLRIIPIPTSHDADISVGYIIESSKEKMVYVTDTGYVRERDLELMRGANYIVLESNHDPAMLMRTKRPYIIKQRILSDTGHLSNEDAGRILKEITTVNTKEIILAHLSQEANSEELAIQTIAQHLYSFTGRLKVARQFEIIYSGE